jgi:hypothetical protein
MIENNTALVLRQELYNQSVSYIFIFEVSF